MIQYKKDKVCEKMNYENFLKTENNKIIFVECWMDRCIDRNDGYIPSYPYWSNVYNPNNWVSEGLDISENKANENMTKLVEMFDANGICIDSCVLFDKDIKYKPNEETGWTVYAIEEFLNIDHKKESYEGYVYYGYSKIVFTDGVLKEDIITVLQAYEDM